MDRTGQKCPKMSHLPLAVVSQPLVIYFRKFPVFSVVENTDSCLWRIAGEISGGMEKFQTGKKGLQ